MRVLDLFSGLKGWSEPFRVRGHETVCVELDPRFPADHRDVMDFDPAKWGQFDIVLASPPCTSFSMMSVGTHWTHDHEPKTETARVGRMLVQRTLDLIKEIKPRFWIIENPRAKLRKMPLMQPLERRTVWYCQYGDMVNGELRAKPTDLWGGFPMSLVLKPECKNWRGKGEKHHAAAPRGSRTGTQGMDSAMSAKIPEALAKAICMAAETDLSSNTETV
jgi:hypothetical protein